MQALSYSIYYVLSTINPFFKLICTLVKTDVHDIGDFRLVSFSIGLLQYFYCKSVNAFRYGVENFNLIINSEMKLQWL